MTQSEFNQLRDELIQQVEEMKKSLREIKISRYLRPTVGELLKAGHKWQPWYAWRPVKDIQGAWHWLKSVYRLQGNTYVDYDNWAWYYYGTDFDLLKEQK